ncbi:hypothetical protein JCM8097_005977 [Rhodosporidiobolus ruineniae]
MPPKRPATTFTEDQPTNRAAAALAGKKLRFAPNNAEAVAADRDADDLELDLEQGGGGNKKRNVVTDGYDSDSSAGSDGGFGGAGGGRKGRGVGEQAAEPDDDEDDMFGGGPGVDKGTDVKGKKKEKEFLDMGDIEGQEFGRDDEDEDPAMPGGPAPDAEDDEEEEEEYEAVDDLANDDDAPRARRSKKGMGFQLSSFNMKEEMNEGRFSADGSYVANKTDPLANHDAWLDGVSKKAIKAAKESKDRMDAKQKQREEDEAKNEEQLTQLRDDCLIGLLSLVRPGETVTKALNRLGNAKKRAEAAEAAHGGGSGKGKSKSTGGGDGDAMEVDDGAPAPSNSTSSSSATSPVARYTSKIDRLTHLASTLLSSHGELEIYSEKYEGIIQTLKSEGAVRRDWVPPVDPDIAAEEEEEREEKQRERERKDRERAESAAASGRSRVVIARPGAGAPAPAGPQYRYKWVSPPEGQDPEQDFGPFDRPTLEAWIAGGYFGAPDEAERIRVKKEGEGEWRSWREVR